MLVRIEPLQLQLDLSGQQRVVQLRNVQRCIRVHVLRQVVGRVHLPLRCLRERRLVVRNARQLDQLESLLLAGFFDAGQLAEAPPAHDGVDGRAAGGEPVRDGGVELVVIGRPRIEIVHGNEGQPCLQHGAG